MKVYISGPIALGGTAPIETITENLKRFSIAKEKLAAEGHEPVSPADKEEVEDESQRLTWLDYMRQDLILIADCDAIYMLEGWHTSKGATLELQIAVCLGYKIMFEGE